MKVLFTFFIVEILIVFVGVYSFIIGKDVHVNNQIGKFQIIHNPLSARFQFLLDTETGRTWKFVHYVDVDRDSWVEVSKDDLSPSEN